ncbi:MAG: hypothetical protein D6732_19740 [Methanobacteriota archaeon]|nr:MAG: hypothetical protein D6732_19740 [Euryarchaeota archaeon]
MSTAEELYEWINSRYEACKRGEISEDEYLKDLAEYKEKLAKLDVGENIPVHKTASGDLKTVKSTSIAGLRKKLLDELMK